MRDLPLLILGLTGPMGAGCTRLARDISKMEPGKVIKKRGLLDVVSRDIAELSRRMRELQPSVQSSGVQKQSDYMGLKRLNRSLAEKLAERACLNVIAKSALPEPVYISITTIILKLAAESITTPEFQEWAKDHAKAADLLKWLRGKWESELTLYDSWEHDASRFSHEELSRMDGMFADFENTGDSMTLEQLESFFGKRKNEFYLRDFGENIRLTGNPFNSRNGHDPVAYASESLVRIAYESDRFIRYYRTRSDEKKSQFFIIDEIKNPGEAEFFRARHQHFYLISIYSNSELRAARLRKTLSDKVKIGRASCRERV